MQDLSVKEGDIVAIMDTSFGDIKIKFFPTLTPRTFENFTTHALNNYYNGTIFHRVINGFMIQGGDPTGTGMGGQSIYGDDFEDEICEELKHIKGAFSMANAGPNTNGSQFFIVQANATPHLNGYHTVFGQVIEGIEIVDKIASQKTDRHDKPVFDIVINDIKVKILKDGDLEDYLPKKHTEV